MGAGGAASVLKFCLHIFNAPSFLEVGAVLTGGGGNAPHGKRTHSWSLTGFLTFLFFSFSVVWYCYHARWVPSFGVIFCLVGLSSLFAGVLISLFFAEVAKFVDFSVSVVFEFLVKRWNVGCSMNFFNPSTTSSTLNKTISFSSVTTCTSCSCTNSSTDESKLKTTPKMALASRLITGNARNRKCAHFDRSNSSLE